MLQLTKDIADWDLRSEAMGGGRFARLFRSFLSWITVGISLNICFLDSGGLEVCVSCEFINYSMILLTFGIVGMLQSLKYWNRVLYSTVMIAIKYRLHN